MNPKILTVLLIVLCFAQYSRQEDAHAVKPATTTVPASATYIAPRAWSADRNHDGVVDWRDGWGWNGADAPARYPVDWNRDGLIDWRDDLAWNGAWGGYRANLAPAAEPVVTRKLGSNASTASTLRSKGRQGGLRAIGDHIINSAADNSALYFSRNYKELLNFIGQDNSNDKKVFDRLDVDHDGFVSVDEFYNALRVSDPNTTKEEISKMFTEAGAQNGKLDFNALIAAINADTSGGN